jgi:hypothetical protein
MSKYYEINIMNVSRFYHPPKIFSLSAELILIGAVFSSEVIDLIL